MAGRPPKACSRIPCPNLTTDRSGLCDKCKAKRWAEVDKKKDPESVAFYHSNSWKTLRKIHLLKHPFCCFCAERGIQRPGNVVDHIVPRRVDQTRQLDPSNLRTCCSRCHNKYGDNAGHFGRK